MVGLKIEVETQIVWRVKDQDVQDKGWTVWKWSFEGSWDKERTLNSVRKY